MLVPPESLSAVLVMMRSESLSICNHSRARLVDSSRNGTFSRGYPNLTRSYGGLNERVSRCWSVEERTTELRTDGGPKSADSACPSAGKLQLIADWW